MKTTPEPRPFGLWESPLTPRAMGARARLGDVRWEPSGRTLVWTESRGGESYLYAKDDGAPRELAVGVRARLGYGGGDFGVGRGRVVYADAKTGRLMSQDLQAGGPVPLTPPFGSAASAQVADAARAVVYVHHDDRHVDRLAVVDADGALWPQILAAGADFYAYPRVSPDGRHVAWIQWSHPAMPWDATTLHVAPLVRDAGGLPRLGEARVVAGAGAQTAVFQPEFTPDGKALLFVSDESGWGHIYEHDLATAATRAVTRGEVEYGAPAWVQEMRTYAVADGGRVLYASANRGGFMRLVRIDRATGETREVAAASAYLDVMQLSAAPTGDKVAFVGSGPATPPRLVVYDAATDSCEVVARVGPETMTAGELSHPRPLSWPTSKGDTCHGLYWPPASARFAAKGPPPLIVHIHGGPTSHSDAGYEPLTQFLTTRGYAVLAVNYRGSTAYGRAYMLKLRKAWGDVDVEDAVSGLRYAAKEGLADPARAVIMGGSAGGYTVLQTMVTHPEAFTAGISYYGIANQFTLVADTHKFEERYNDSLLGILPEDAALYRERSPLFHAHKIKRPVAVFQGEDDKVVPKEQAESLVKALQRNGVPHVYHLYKGEGHGWRKPETIEHFFGAVDAFLRQHVIFS